MKKAVLVTLTFTTRVVVPDHFNNDRIVSCAATNIKSKLDKNLSLEVNNAVQTIRPDIELPYDPEKDVRPAFGVWDGI